MENKIFFRLINKTFLYYDDYLALTTVKNQGT